MINVISYQTKARIFEVYGMYRFLQVKDRLNEKDARDLEFVNNLIDQIGHFEDPENSEEIFSLEVKMLDENRQLGGDTRRYFVVYGIWSIKASYSDPDAERRGQLLDHIRGAEDLIDNTYRRIAMGGYQFRQALSDRMHTLKEVLQQEIFDVRIEGNARNTYDFYWK